MSKNLLPTVNMLGAYYLFRSSFYTITDDRATFDIYMLLNFKQAIDLVSGFKYACIQYLTVLVKLCGSSQELKDLSLKIKL